MRPRPLRRHPASGAFNPDPSLGQAEDGDKFYRATSLRGGIGAFVGTGSKSGFRQ